MGEDKNYRIQRQASRLTIRVSGGSQQEILANSAFALFDVMVDLETVRTEETVPLEAEGVDSDDLMLNWMREVLYSYQGSGYLLKQFDIREVGDFFIRAEARGEKYDPDRHEIREEMNAVGDRNCRLGKTGDQWTAQAGFEL